MMSSSQSGLGQVVEFFNVRASGTDVSSAIGITNVLMSIAILIVSVLGFTALAIWVARIGVDILLITLRGTAIADKLSSFGTAKSESYDSVGKYLKNNFVEILLVVVLIALMVTGWLWRIFAIALQGVGGVLNFLLGLDFDGLLSAQDVNAWKDNVTSQPPAAVKNEYDENVALAESTLNELYSMTDMDNDVALKQDVIRRYTIAMSRAQWISEQADGQNGADVVGALNLESTYFARHKTTNYCNTAFLNSDAGESVKQYYGTQAISCSTHING